jgi:hypothetical protein
MTYTITREQVTLVPTSPYTVRNGRIVKTRITHPIVYTVAENGQDVRSFDTSSEAQEWVNDRS